ncbi:MAG: hypothetical protein JWQ87_798 [Candidatus Sulfotelmatobacter sp.]|nr:hypothetical protein [Candidatus Sulfotelmatobacter sp.]
MKNTLIRNILALAIAGGVSLSATSALAQGGSDAFNRPRLGTRWVTTSGSLSISNHKLVGTSLSLGYLTASSHDTAASAVVFLGSTDLEYGAVALGDIAGGSNAFVKIQAQNGAGTFDHAAFYTGNNGSGNFFTLSSPVPSPATLDVFFCGTVATMRITSSAGVQTYTNDYGTTYTAGGGLGTYGSVGIDNYVGFHGACTSAPVHGVPASSMPHDTDLSLAK